MFRSPSRQGATALLALLAVAATAAAASAQTGATLTPNQRNYMVNKDIGTERWTINVNLSSDDPTSITNVTGNIFRADGGPPSFVLCQVRPESQGTLNDPSSEFRLTCQGTDACQSTATDCARDGWNLINDDVRIPASFFLPPGGLGATASASAAGLAARLGATLAGVLADVRGWVAASPAASVPPGKVAGGSNRGATLSLDKLNFLVNKDVGAERWSISLNYVPQQTDEGGVVPRLESVTGNVFQPDGSPPSFIFCTARGDSTGNLDDASSEFRFACDGTGACDVSARDCATTRWTRISDDVRLSASFFLPPGGLPASPQSDPDIIIIGRTSDPPSIITSNFATSQGAAAARPQGTCPTGAQCFVPTLGSCEDVRGRVVEAEGICGCFVEDVSSQCVGCGDGASGQCGGECGFPVGGAQARGQCLPFSPDSSECACYAIGSGESRQAAQGCGGPQGVGCSGDRCCTDDPRDGCDPLDGGAGCFGICVAVDDCDPSREQCGSCLSIDGGQFCGNGDREGSEQCDRSDLAGNDCSSFGFSGGGNLRCSSTCRFDTRDCTAGGNNPPVITSISLPPVLDPNAGPVDGTVRFEDPDGDIVQANFEPISGNIDGASFDPDVFGRASGSFDFFVDCRGNVADYVLAVTLEDQQGNVSDAELVEFSCQSTAECGNGSVESGEVCDPPGSGGGCGSGFLCTNDCSDCVSATSCEGRCCPGRDDFCTPPDAQCYCDEFCRTAEDCCTDVSSACGF